MSTHSIGELLKGFVLADSTVGGLVESRMYPVRLPQKVTFPAIVYTRVSGLRIGQLNAPASAAEPRYQIDAWASTQKAALELGQAIRHRLDNYAGMWSDSDSPPTSVFVQVRFDTERDFFEEDILGGQCRHSADYFIFHGTDGGTL